MSLHKSIHRSKGTEYHFKCLLNESLCALPSIASSNLFTMATFPFAYVEWKPCKTVGSYIPPLKSKGPLIKTLFIIKVIMDRLEV